MDVQVSMPPPPPPPPPGFFPETTTSQLTPPPPPQGVTTTTTVNAANPAPQDRIWLHPWTVTEMREHASQWSLAGDAGVLNYLEQFSDRLTQRADAIQQHLNQTVNAVKSTHTRVLNCLNEFTSLANTQFIENRVYDEDETANPSTGVSKKDEPSTDKTNVNNTEAQEKVLQRYVETIQYGLQILDTHFERVDPKLDNNQNGRSSFIEDDDDVGGAPPEIILEPKDPYILRPLPYLIGSAQFMQDDYVGLGDLLVMRDEDGYDMEQITKIDTDSASSSDDEQEEVQEDENEFKAQMSSAPPAIVQAGASVNQLPTNTNYLTDDSENEDDPFGLDKNIPSFNDISSKPPVVDDKIFYDEPKPPKQASFDSDSDKEDDGIFDSSIKKPPVNVLQNKYNSDDKSSESEKEPDEPEVPKKKVKSELELAVERRRKALGDRVSSASDDDDDDDKIVQKPSKPSNETIKSKSKPPSEGPSSNTISNLTSQPLTKPQTSIFGEPDDDEDIFSAPSKPVSTIPTTKIPPKKEKDMFDDSDDGDDPFSITPAPSTLRNKNEPISKPQPTVINKPRPIIHTDVSDEDDLFGSTVIKPQSKPSKTTSKLSDDEGPPHTNKPPVQPVIFSPAPVAVPSVKKPTPTVDDDSDEEIFNSSKKTPQTPTSGPQKVIQPLLSDDDDDMFPAKPLQTKPTPPVNSPPVHSTPSTKTNVYEDPLRIKKPVETTPQSSSSITKTPLVSSKKNLSDDDVDSDEDSGEDSTPKRELNPLALKEGEKLNVKAFASKIKIPMGAPKQGLRPKASSITEEPPKRSGDDDIDDDQPIQKLQPSPAIAKKTSKLNLDSDEGDDPFSIAPAPSTLKNKNEPISKPQPTVINKPRPIIHTDESDDEDLFGSKVIKPQPQPSKTTLKLSDDEGPPHTNKPPVQPVISSPAPVVVPSVKNPTLIVDDDSDDEIFGLSKTKPQTPTAGSQKVIQPPQPITKTNVYEDPLGIKKPVETIPQSSSSTTKTPPVSSKKNLSDDDVDSDEDLTPKRELNPLALKEGERRSVKDFASMIKIPMGGPKPGLRPKASSITEEPPKRSVDDEESIQNLQPSSAVVKKTSKFNSDSGDDDEIFNTKKPSTIPVVEQKNKTIIENENETGKTSIKDLSSRIKLPGAHPKPPSNESNNTTHKTSNEASKDEPTIDKAALKVFHDRAKVVNKNRAPRTRPSRASGAAAATISTNENDDLFASPKSTKTVSSSPPVPAAVAITPPPPPSTAVPITPPPPRSTAVPITSPPPSTAVPVTTETKSSVVSKAMTKSSILTLDDDDDDFLKRRPIKKGAKPVDNDDIFGDVKSKGPQVNKAKKDWSIMSKSTTAETDDIFNDISTKSSNTTKPKTTTVKSKPAKNFDDIFDDPLNVSSKS